MFLPSVPPTAPSPEVSMMTPGDYSSESRISGHDPLCPVLSNGSDECQCVIIALVERRTMAANMTAVSDLLTFSVRYETRSGGFMQHDPESGQWLKKSDVAAILKAQAATVSLSA